MLDIKWGPAPLPFETLPLSPFFISMNDTWQRRDLLTPFYSFGSYLQVTASTVFHYQTWRLWALATSQ